MLLKDQLNRSKATCSFNVGITQHKSQITESYLKQKRAFLFTVVNIETEPSVKINKENKI